MQCQLLQESLSFLAYSETTIEHLISFNQLIILHSIRFRGKKDPDRVPSTLNICPNRYYTVCVYLSMWRDVKGFCWILMKASVMPLFFHARKLISIDSKFSEQTSLDAEDLWSIPCSLVPSKFLREWALSARAHKAHSQKPACQLSAQ